MSGFDRSRNRCISLINNGDQPEDGWLLEPKESSFPSPEPACSSTGLSAASYKYQSTPDQMKHDLERCNKALRKLMRENSELQHMIKSTMGVKDEGSEQPVKSDFQEEEDAERRQSQNDSIPKKEPIKDASIRSAETYSSHVFHSGDVFSISSVQARLLGLSRLADQEAAVSMYRDLLCHVGGEMGHMETQMKWLALEMSQLLTAAEFWQGLREEEMMAAEVERLVLLEEIKIQAEEAESAVANLRMQLDSADRRARRNKIKAAARIAELNLVLETSHLDLQCLRRENKILRDQLENSNQSEVET